MIVKRISNNELYHHGVKGQEWGVRNGPPYPLNATGKALLKQQKLMQKQKDAMYIRAVSAQESNKRNNNHSGSVMDNIAYDAKKVDQHYLDNVNKKRIKAAHDYYDYKMRLASGDKSVKKDYKKVKKYMRKVNNFDTSTYTDGSIVVTTVDPASGAMREAYDDQKRVSKAYRQLHKTIKKYGYLDNDRNVKQISKAIEKANKVLSEIDGERIDSYRIDSNGDITIDSTRPSKKPVNTLRLVDI